MIEASIGLFWLVVIFAITLITAMALRFFRQPSVVAYLLAGVFISALGIVNISDQTIAILGDIGIILLLFFVGMELDMRQLLANWRVAVIGTLLQAAFSVLAVFAIGSIFDWPFSRSILLGFVISLSSTAVVIKLLETKGLIKTRLGLDIITILIAQDIIVIPMLVIVSALGSQAQAGSLVLQLTGLVLAATFVAVLVIYKKPIHLPFRKWLRGDHEMQLFAAAIICLGFSSLAALFELSVAFGAFLAGMFVARTSETGWVSTSLHGFKVVFLAFFFISIGLLVDLEFLMGNLGAVLLIVAAVFLTGTGVNFFIFRWLGESWRYSLIAGVLLSQAGEFGFLLVAAGFRAGVVDGFVYQAAVSVIAITLLFSPLWAGLFSRTLAKLPCNAQGKV